MGAHPDAMYDPFADAFDAHALRSSYNALYDRPAVLALVGDASGLDVLDAGCGPGYYTEALVGRGARVTAFDASPRMVELTRDKVGKAAQRLVLSTVHPMADWQRLGGSYFDRSSVSEEWNDGWAVRFWRQPLSAWCQEFHDAGFLIERLVEPLPEEAMAHVDPAAFESLRRSPAFIGFSLLAPYATQAASCSD